MSLAEYLVLACSSLFVIVDPIALVPAFLAMTDDDEAHRRRTAAVACAVAALVLMGFAAGGPSVLAVLGGADPDEAAEKIIR